MDKNQPNNRIVISDAMSGTAIGRFMQTKAGLVLLTLLFVGIVGGGVALTLNWTRGDQPKATQKTLAKNPALVRPDTYVLLSKEAAQQKVRTDVGADMESLKKSPITAKSFDNFEQAYVVAQAFAGQDNSAKALEAFVAAAQIVPKDVPYDFYLAYAEAFKTKNPTDQAGYKKLLEQAKQALEATTTLKPEEKAARLQDLNYQIDPEHNPAPES